MKIGVWLGWDGRANYGGAFSYTEKLIKGIDGYHFSKGIEICYVTLLSQNIELQHDLVRLSQLPNFLYKCFAFSEKLTKLLARVDMKIVKKMGLSKVLKKSNIKVMYYIQQWTYIDSDFPFIANNWDIGHLSTYTFPEFTREHNFERRDDFYQNILPKALMILCESETGKRELLQYTKIGEHKLRVMPIFAGNVSKVSIAEDSMRHILKDYSLETQKYFYYPAQFWAHKNHYGLLRAFKKFVKIHGSQYKLVLSGSNQGNMDYIKSLVDYYGLQNNVLFLGFVSIETVFTLYKNALCLVMASHFGPTNMPPIEAMEIGCPVICSDLGGHREILGDSSIYFNSYQHESIFDAMELIYNKREKYLNKIIAQRDITIFNIDTALDRLNDILSEVVIIRSSWD